MILAYKNHIQVSNKYYKRKRVIRNGNGNKCDLQQSKQSFQTTSSLRFRNVLGIAKANTDQS